MQGKWAFYHADIEDNLAFIYVDLAFKKRAPLVRLGDLASLQVAMCDPALDGLGSADEYDELCEIEDAIQVAVDAVDDAYYVGRTICDGSRDFFIYCQNGQQMEMTLGQIMVPYHHCLYDIGYRRDREWSAYLDYLYPTQRDMQLIKNQCQMETLKSRGDDCDVVRPVEHWAYFHSVEDREKYITIAAEHGFKTTGRSVIKADKSVYCAVLGRADSIEYWSFNDVVLLLFDIAEVVGGRYDGWISPVAKSRVCVSRTC